MHSLIPRLSSTCVQYCMWRGPCTNGAGPSLSFVCMHSLGLGKCHRCGAVFGCSGAILSAIAPDSHPCTCFRSASTDSHLCNEQTHKCLPNPHFLSLDSFVFPPYLIYIIPPPPPPPPQHTQCAHEQPVKNPESCC